MPESHVEVTAAQADVLRSRAKHVLAVAGIRGGKTHVGALRTLIRAISTPCASDECHAVVSPTFPMSKIGPEPKLFKLLNDPKVFPTSPLMEWVRSERLFLLRTTQPGRVARLRIFSGDAYDRWRGDKWLSLWADEAAYLTAEAWDVAQGRLAETDAPTLFTTTPNGMNFLWDLAKEASEVRERTGYLVKTSPDRQVTLISWASTSNTFLPTLKGFENLAARYDPDTYAQEVLAQFVARAGRVYKHFDRERHLRDVPISPFLTVRVGQDFNVGRMVSVFCQEVRHRDGRLGLHVLDELELRDADTIRLTRELSSWAKRRGVPQRMLVVNPDASSRKRQTAGSDTTRSDLAILRAAGFEVQGPRANPPVKDRVNCVNGLFHAGLLTVDPRCELLIEALEGQLWDDDGKPTKDGVLDNRVDALGYAAWALAPLRDPRASVGRRET